MMHDLNSVESDLIYETLIREYPAEIKKIQLMQANDMGLNGYISKETERQMNALMDRVVADNRRLGRT